MIEISDYKKDPSLKVQRLRLSASGAQHVRVAGGPQQATGFGSDANFGLAQQKAFFEWLERSVFRKERGAGDETSSGWAAHRDPRLAKRNAELELLERDALLCSWLGKIPPAPAGFVSVAGVPNPVSVLRFGQGKGFVVLGLVLEHPVYRTRMVISAAADSESQAKAKLHQDADRALQILGQKKSFADPMLERHHRSFQEQSAASLAWLESRGVGIEYRSFRFSYRTFEIPLWNGETGFVVKAECPELQALFYGPPALGKLNRARLRSLSLRSLNRELHPLL